MSRGGVDIVAFDASLGPQQLNVTVIAMSGIARATGNRPQIG